MAGLRRGCRNSRHEKSDSVEMTDSMMDDHHRFSVVIYDAVAPCQELPIPAVQPKQ
jgi:hypothetical protein